jgi:histidinol-phosphate aminotransferase
MIETKSFVLPDTATDGVARLDANESALGPPLPGVRALTTSAQALHRYPRGAHRELVGALADHWGVRAECLILTNGVDEAIDLVTALVDRVSCTVPGFDAFWTRAEGRGLPVTRIPLDGRGRPTIGPERVGPGGAIFLARPNNPTGTVVERSWLLGLPPRVDVVFVDETYIDFSADDGVLDLPAEWPNVCVFRSLSKSFGLAGLRLGAVVAPPLLAANLRERQRFYPVDTIALSVAASALRDADGHVERHRAYVVEQRGELVAMLRRSGLFVEVLDTETSFVVARCADPGAAVRLQSALAELRVYVLECTTLGYPGRLRISVGPPEEMEVLRHALAHLAAGAN